MTPQDQKKRKTAEAAIEYIKDARVIGVGTGSTVNHFIDMGKHKKRTIKQIQKKTTD